MVVALLLFASGLAVSKETKQTMTNLESVLAASPSANRDFAWRDQSWSRLSEQHLRVDKWSLCRG